METNYFALRDGKIVYVPDVPIIIPSVEIVGNLIKNKSRYKRDQQYKQALQSAIANGKVVENQWEVMRHIFRTNEKAQYLLESTLYSLQCRVDEIDFVRAKGTGVEWTEFIKIKRYSLGNGWETKTLARVTFDEQPEKKPCANCKETIDPCACMRNKCVNCDEPVGNITFSLCDDCWDLRYSKPVDEPEAAGQEQESEPPILNPVPYERGKYIAYGKYLVVRKDGNTHLETYNGTGWAYNDNAITFYYLPKIS